MYAMTCGTYSLTRVSTSASRTLSVYTQDETTTLSLIETTTLSLIETTTLSLIETTTRSLTNHV